MLRVLSFCFVLCCLLPLACQNPSGKPPIHGTWQGAHLENAVMDSFFARSQRLIDTIGRGHSTTENLEFYGTSNIDSLRHSFQLKHDSAQKALQMRVTGVRFFFGVDKTALISFDSGITTDTARWTLDDEYDLILEDRSAGGERTVKKMKLLSVKAAQMTLKIWSNNDSSVLTLDRVTNQPNSE